MLIADQISFRYPQDGTGLDPVSLQVDRGEFVAGSGVSGSGKSTLARCLSGLIPHLYRGTMRGEVQVQGISTRESFLFALAEEVGLVFQNPSQQMLAPTVEDEILFGLENLGLSRTEIARRLEDSLARFGLEPLRGRSPQSLSSGEMQKVALAAITARRPPFLILDEPLSMLDTTASHALIRYLDRLRNHGQAVVLFEHRLEWLEGIPEVKSLTLPQQQVSVPESIPDCPLPLQDHFTLAVEDLSLRIGQKGILEDIDFTAASGELVAIVGQNGVGKTTLLRAVAGLQSYRGSIELHGSPGVEEPDLGLVFENPDLQLFNASVEKEITYRIEAPDFNYYRWLLHSLGLTPYEQASPLLLSEGEKKRLALAAVLMRNPAHGVLLDEPSLGQDMTHKQLLVKMLRKYAESGKVTIFATHDLHLTYQADKIIVLGKNSLIAAGNPQALYRQKSVWKEAGLVLPGWAQPGKLERWNP